MEENGFKALKFNSERDQKIFENYKQQNQSLEGKLKEYLNKDGE